MLTAELMQRQQGAVEGVEGDQAPDPFVFSPQMVRDLDLMEFARRVIGVAQRWQPGLLRASSAKRRRPERTRLSPRLQPRVVVAYEPPAPLKLKLQSAK